MKQIITFTSDLGNQDFYLPQIKGEILCADDSLVLVDISNNVHKFDVMHGALTLKFAYSSFPKGTIHLLLVNLAFKSNIRLLVLEKDGHFFIGPDNGSLSIFCSQYIKNSKVIGEAKHYTELLPSMIDLILQIKVDSRIPETLPICDAPNRLVLSSCRFQENNIVASVIYIDHFGNALLNLEKHEFDLFVKDSRYIIETGRFKFKQIHQGYADVVPGECAVFFNQVGLLEIGINTGSAKDLLGLGYNSVIRISLLS